MTTTHLLFVTADMFQPGERKTMTMRQVIGTSDDEAISIAMTTSGNIELHSNITGAELVVQMGGLYAMGEQLFQPTRQAPDQESRSRELAEAMERFDNAARAHAWIGSQPPEAHDDIRTEYHRARAYLWLLTKDTAQQLDDANLLLELGSGTMHQLVDGALDLAEQTLTLAPEGDDRVGPIRERIAQLRGLAPVSH